MKANWRKQMMISALALTLSAANAAPVFASAAPDGKSNATEIARQMGAEITDKGNIKTDEEMATTIPGLFAAGDCTGGLLQVSKAVYEGSMAAISAGKYVRHKKVS